MNLATIIEALRARCPGFSNRIAGAAQFKLLPESAALAVPCAFVVPLDDNPTDSQSQNSVRQGLTDSFAVIVALDNTGDERGQAAATSVHSTRATLWSALLGWSPAIDYDGIIYEGGTLLQLDRARCWYQFEFSALMEIGPEDGWQGIELAALPHFDGATINVDQIDPAADPNLQYPGPDGRIEVTFKSPQSGNMP